MRASAVSAWRSDQANTSTAKAMLPSPTSVSASGPRSPARRAATLPAAGLAMSGATRVEPQRRGSLSAATASPSRSVPPVRFWPAPVGAAALVLFVDVAGLLVLLVPADRLVLGAVVGREVRAAQREQRRHQAQARDRGFAPDRARPLRAQRLSGRGGGRHRGEGA